MCVCCEGVGGHIDEAVELAQVTLVCVRQAVHAVVVHCGLTPHTPEGGTGGHKPIRNARKYTKVFLLKGARPRIFTGCRGAGLPPTLTSDL